MARKRSIGDGPGKADKAVEAIQPTAVYGSADAQRLLGISDKVLSREVNAGRVKVRKRGTAWQFLGQWLIDWINAEAVTQP